MGTTCHTCSRRMLSLFTRSFTDIERTRCSPTKTIQRLQPSQPFSTARRLRSDQAHAEPPKPFATNRSRTTNSVAEFKDRPAWQVQKEAVKEKLGGAAWNPRKKLSPDTMEGIRHLHQTQPDKFTTPILAQHFQVSSESIRRILKSKWRPSDDEQDKRLQRWDKRGEKIWSNLVELGVKPPKKWRDMGVGKARKGEKPTWKSRARNTVPVHDSYSDEDIIPIADENVPSKQSRRENMPLSERMGV